MEQVEKYPTRIATSREVSKHPKKESQKYKLKAKERETHLAAGALARVFFSRTDF